jgi:hypothetical protein
MGYSPLAYICNLIAKAIAHEANPNQKYAGHQIAVAA